MVRGAMALMKGFHIGTVYKFLRYVDSTGWNNIVALKVKSTLTHLDSN
jgi:hypothetical protein